MDGGLCLASLGHLNEAEALRRSGLCVGDDRTGLHRAEGLEQVFEFLFGGLARHVPNDQFHTASVASDTSLVSLNAGTDLQRLDACRHCRLKAEPFETDSKS